MNVIKKITKVLTSLRDSTFITKMHQMYIFFFFLIIAQSVSEPLRLTIFYMTT